MFAGTKALFNTVYQFFCASYLNPLERVFSNIRVNKPHSSKLGACKCFCLGLSIAILFNFEVNSLAVSSARKARVKLIERRIWRRPCYCPSWPKMHLLSWRALPSLNLPPLPPWVSRNNSSTLSHLQRVICESIVSSKASHLINKERSA